MRFFQGYTNLLSTTVFWWMNWIFRLGYSRALELEDLGSLSKVHTTKYNRDKFEEALGIELVKVFKFIVLCFVLFFHDSVVAMG